MRRAIRALLWVTALLTFGLGAVSALMFYQSYLKWYGLFENGRYFDPVDSVVHTDSSAVIGLIAALFWIICGITIVVARRMKG